MVSVSWTALLSRPVRSGVPLTAGDSQREATQRRDNNAGVRLPMIEQETNTDRRSTPPPDADGRCPLCANVTGAIRNRNAVAFGVSDRRNNDERERERDRDNKAFVCNCSSLLYHKSAAAVVVLHSPLVRLSQGVLGAVERFSPTSPVIHCVRSHCGTHSGRGGANTGRKERKEERGKKGREGQGPV